MSKLKKEKNIQFNRHWGSWAKGYLKLAEQGFLYLKNQKNIGRKSKPTYLLEDGCLIIASIWNIKHGIELIIKGLGINIDKKYWQKHDLNDLLNDLEKKGTNLYIKKHIDVLKKITDKYYRCSFSKKTNFVDTENTFFKYPELGCVGGVSLNYSFVHDLKRKDINQFLKDIHNLGIVYDILEGQPKSFQNAKKWGISKKQRERELLSVPTMRNCGFQ